MKGTCASCRKMKYEVHGKKSELLPQINLLMCRRCIGKGYEPRHIIIAAARARGVAVASRFIVEGLYEGDPILASDIVKSN